MICFCTRKRFERCTPRKAYFQPLIFCGHVSFRRCNRCIGSGVYVCIPGTLWWPRDFSQLFCLEFGPCFGGGKIPLNDLPDWNMLSLLAGRKFCKWQTDWPLGSHQSWAWNCWIWICRKKHAVAPLQVHDVWSTKSAECSLKSFHRFQLTGPSWKHSNRKCCLYNLQVNLQVYTYGCLKFILYSISIYIILIIYYTTRPFDQKPILLKQTQQQTHQPTTFFTTLHHLRGNPSTPLPSSSSLGDPTPLQRSNFFLDIWSPGRRSNGEVGIVDLVSGSLLHPQSFSQRMNTPESHGWLGLEDA